MKKVAVQLKRVNDAFHFEALDEQGNTVNLDAAEEIGGSGEGVRPMQMLLMALGGCSGIDVCLILQRQRQVVEALDISVEGSRQEDHEPNLYEQIDVHFDLKGDLDKDKVQRAVSLSMDKYCSVAKIMERSAKIDYTITINGE